MDKDDIRNESDEPPKIFCTLPPLLFKQNNPASIPIKVTGTPSPEIRWYILGVPADCCQGYKVSTGPGRKSHPYEILTVLEISNVDQCLEGGVEVTATNSLGTDRFVVPLKTYRLLSGIYLEEEDENDGKKLKGFGSCRTIDKRLFRNEVDEACKGIKIYQAYNSISKSYDDCNTNFSDDENVAVQQWKRKMAKRNLMKSIDDIIDSDHDSGASPNIKKESKPPSSHVPGNVSGNNSFRNVNIVKTCSGLPRLKMISGRSNSLAKKSNDFKISRVEADSADKNTLFSFYGQKLSEFCEKLLHVKNSEGNKCNIDDSRVSESVVKRKNSHIDNMGAHYYFCDDSLGVIKDEAVVYSEVIRPEKTDVTNTIDSELSSIVCGQVNKIRKANIENVLRGQGDWEEYDDSIPDGKMYENVQRESHHFRTKEREDVAKFPAFVEEKCISNKPFESSVIKNRGEIITRYDAKDDLNEAVTPSAFVKKHGICKETQHESLEENRKGDLTIILSELNEQLEEWKTENEVFDCPILRPDYEKLQNRNYQCKSENLEESSVLNISEFSKSLDELTESLSNFEYNKNRQESLSKLSLSKNIKYGDVRDKNLSSSQADGPMSQGETSVTKAQVVRRSTPLQKPVIPPKPKFLNDQVISHQTESSKISCGMKQKADVPFSPCQTTTSSFSLSTSSYSATENFSPSAFFTFNSSTPSSSYSSRSFTPSPRAVSECLFSSFTPSSASSSPATQDLSPHSSASCTESSFTPSPKLLPDEHNLKSTFCSTKYKLVRPPALHYFSETPSTSSPLPAPLSCPGSVEMSRKKTDILWVPNKAKKSFKVYKLSSKDGKSLFCRTTNDFESSSGSSGNVSKLDSNQPKLMGLSTTTKSLEILPERRDSFASMEKYKGLSNSRKALSKRYELVTITTKEETVTLKNMDGTKFRRRSIGKTVFSNPPESLNAAERLYYLLGGGKERNISDNGHRCVVAGDDANKEEEEGVSDSPKLRIDAYKLPQGDRADV